jgi:hypothetical protein
MGLFVIAAGIMAVLHLVLASERPRLAIFVSGALWLLYAVYEYYVATGVLCDADCNIRVDLVFFWPILGLAAFCACQSYQGQPGQMKVIGTLLGVGRAARCRACGGGPWVPRFRNHRWSGCFGVWYPRCQIEAQFKSVVTPRPPNQRRYGQRRGHARQAQPSSVTRCTRRQNLALTFPCALPIAPMMGFAHQAH